jgi:hypothetical protein
MMSQRVHWGVPGPIETIHAIGDGVVNDTKKVGRASMTGVEIIVAITFLFCAIALIVSVVVIIAMVIAAAFLIALLIAIGQEIARHVKAKRAMMVTTDPTLEER